MFKKIVVVGLGLMGGSLAASCRKKFPRARIVGVSRSREALSMALKRRWVHEATNDVAAGASVADLVVLCTPVDTFLPYLKAIDKVCAKGALVMDVGSVKASVLKQVSLRQWKNLSFVGCHPMVGSHERGISAACARLYDRGLVILTRDKRTVPEAFQKARKFWRRFAARIVELGPEVHDKLIGEISHLPHAVATCLVQAVSGPALKLAATGFRHTTRIAASSSSVWGPIFTSNRREVIGALSRFERELRKFKKLLQGRDREKLVRFLDQAQRKRKSL